jgi:hypothetical protein
MGNSIEIDNQEITEGSVHTIKSQSYEVPNSSGATRVLIKDIELDVDIPDSISGADSDVQSVVMLGKATPSNAHLNNNNSVISASTHRYNTSAVSFSGPQSKEILLLEIQKNSDGKFYYTVAVVGSINSTAVKSARTSASFMVFR